MAILPNPTNLPVVYVANPVLPAGSALTFTNRRAITNGKFVLFTAAAAAAVPANQAMKLHDVPAAGYAVLSIEAAAGAVAGSVLARYWQDANLPTTTEGIPLRDGDIIEIFTALNIQNFRIRSSDDRAHSINIQYYTAI